MPWQTPVTDWDASKVARPSDFNRMEGNIAELKKAGTIDILDAGNHFESNNVEGALQELAGNVLSGKSVIASAIFDMGQSANQDMTFAELATKIRAISTDANAEIQHVLTGKTFYAGGSKKTGTMPNRGAVVITPGTSNKAISDGYHNGSGYVVGDADLVAANIRTGKNLFGVAGNFTADATAVAADILQNKTAYVNGNKITGSMTNQGVKTITPGTSDQALSGFYAAGSKVAGDSDLIAENIVQGKQIFGVTGSAFVPRFGRYTVNRVLYEERPASGRTYTMARLNNDGSYCTAFRAGSYIIMYKRTGDAWARVYEGTLGSDTWYNLNWSPGGVYLLAADSSGTVALIKRIGDTLSLVSQIKLPAETPICVSTWDSTSTYCLVRFGYNIYLIKRAGDTISSVSTVSASQVSSYASVSGDKDLRYIVAPDVGKPKLIERVADALTVRFTSSDTALSDYYVINPDGTYVIGLARDTVRLYRRDGNMLTRILYGEAAILATGGLFPSQNRPPCRMTSDNAYPLIFARNTSDTAVPLVASVGIDTAAEKVRCIMIAPNLQMWGASTLSGPYAAEGLCSDYSADGNHLVLVAEREYTGNDTIFFIKVGAEP